MAKPTGVDTIYSRRRKPAVAPTTATFTRSEFMLLAALLEEERDSPLGRINDNYQRTIEELLARVRAVVGDNRAVTDNLVVTG